MVDNLNEFSRDYQEEHQRAGRVALAWDGDGAFTADYFFEIGEIESTPIYYQVPALEALPTILWRHTRLRRVGQARRTHLDADRPAA